ncbi:MAG: hypothetical protein JXQ76_07725 [Campylobacterales bacterium]|nr:hypothetical protein [Campylobacterales bacterium]
MKQEYNLSTMKSRPNPYVDRFKREITIETEESVIEFFRNIAQKRNTSYQELISSYLKECMNSNRELSYKG